MPIAFACASCRKRLSVRDELAGQRVRCPACGNVAAVPQSTPAPAGPVGPGPVSAGDGRTLPPTVSAAPEARPLPPTDRGEGGQESLAEAGGHTPSSERPEGQPTDSLAGEAPGKELYDFLAPPEAADELGRLGGFRILKVLGYGGMGVVFQGEDPRLGRKVALKAMLPHLAGSPSARQRFLREARAAAALEHDHVVPILAVGEDRGAPYIVMPFLKGEPLDQRLRRQGRLPVAEVLRIGRETAEGLAAAHAQGLVHRDIKPANLWLETRGEPGASATGGRVKILDFGLARAAADEAHLTQTGAIVGTPAYMAPEQAHGGVPDARCDLFSLGCVLYRLCTGAVPFKGRDSISTLVAVATQDPKPPAEVSPGVPPALSDLVMRLLAKEPEQRPPSAQAVAAALQDMASQTAAPEARPQPGAGAAPGGDTVQLEVTRPRPGRTGRKPVRRAWLVVGCALSLGLLAAAVLFLRPAPHGLVRVESDDPEVEVAFGEAGPTIRGTSAEPLSLPTGEHGLLVKRWDSPFEAGKVLIEDGKTLTLKMDFRQGKMDLVRDGRVVESRAIPLPPTLSNSLGMRFALIRAGTFTMGSPAREIDRVIKETPHGPLWVDAVRGEAEHQVEITRPFYMGATEVTVGQFRRFVAEAKYRVGDEGWQKPGFAQADDHPVVCVSWHNAVDFCAWLSKKEGKVYRLPTEAEWEYCCRAGGRAGSRYCFGDDDGDLTLYAWYDRNSGGRTHPVGQLKANAWGLYDMHGNANEWCQDDGDPGHYQRSAKRNPPGPGAGHVPLIRGGCWNSEPERCRCAVRNSAASTNDRYNGMGFRVVLRVTPPGDARP
jgi:formylglycine-generating enzyme required for sulfatase activity